MAEQSTYRTAQKFELPFSNTTAVGLITLLAVVTILIVPQIWWLTFLFIEFVFILCCGQLLAHNLPRRIHQQIELNGRRADGSKSSRRAQIEKDSVNTFKQNATICFAFTMIPVNAIVFSYCFFLPYLRRFSENHEFNAGETWLRVFLDPVFQIIVLSAILMAICYGSIMRIYLRLLKDLDDEISLRAERYSVHDLIHPRRKSSKR